MKDIYNKIVDSKEKGTGLLAILLDPDKLSVADLMRKTAMINRYPVDFLFVGGSSVKPGETDRFVGILKQQTRMPVVLFPGDYTQITPQADAVLFLSLLSGNNPEYLIGQQVKSVKLLQQTDLEVIPTAYLLIDGGKETAVQRVSKTDPIPQNEMERIVETAVAGMYLGKKLIYLEAGSGAQKPVSGKIIAEVRKNTDIPMIVGGGIRTAEQLQTAYQNGADLVVIGNGFEKNKNLIEKLNIKLKKQIT